MERNWLLGFLEAQGCFCIVIKRNNDYKQITPSFSIKLGLLERELLERIGKELGGIGNIYTEKGSATFKVTKLEDIEKIISIFDWMSFESKRKRTEFEIWKNCIGLIKEKKHLTKEGLLKIAMLRDMMQKKNIGNKIGFCDIHNEIEPCAEYKKKKIIPENCNKCF